MSVIFFLFAWAMIAFAPRTPLGRVLRRVLVEAPAAMIAAGPLKTAAKVLAVLAVVGMAYAAPELVMVFGAVDLAAMVEMAMFAMLLAHVVRVKVVGRLAARAIRRAVRRTGPGLRRPRGRARRTSRTRRTSPAANDDAPEVVRRAA